MKRLVESFFQKLDERQDDEERSTPELPQQMRLCKRIQQDHTDVALFGNADNEVDAFESILSVNHEYSGNRHRNNKRVWVQSELESFYA